MPKAHKPKDHHPYAFENRDFNLTDDVDIDLSPVPCFNFGSCGNLSVACKGGKSLCRKCLEVTTGLEYPLRTAQPNGALRRIDYSLAMASATPAV